MLSLFESGKYSACSIRSCLRSSAIIHTLLNLILIYYIHELHALKRLILPCTAFLLARSSYYSLGLFTSLSPFIFRLVICSILCTDSANLFLGFINLPIARGRWMPLFYVSEMSGYTTFKHPLPC